MSFNPNNWAHGKNKPYDGPVREHSRDTVYFMVFDGAKPYKAGIRADKVVEKTADWDKKRIGYKRLES